MSEKKRRVFRRMVLLCTLTLLSLIGSLLGVRSMLAASGETIILTTVQDTYTNINMPTTNYNGRALSVANSPGPPEANDVTTKKIYLSFDLNSIDFKIRSAVLSLSTLTCGGQAPVDAVDITVYGVDNATTWTEDTLTWATQPVTSTGVLASLDAGGIVANRSQIYTWTDDSLGELATWLETQRGVNDGRATLVLVIDNANNPGLADVFFEDSEGTGAAYGCTDSLGGPALTVSNTFAGHKIYLPLVVRQA